MELITMKFYYYNKHDEEVEIDFRICEDSINHLVDGGYMTDEFDVEDFEQSNTYDALLSDAIIDCLADISEENGYDDPQSLDAIISAIDMNYFFCQFLSWKWN